MKQHEVKKERRQKKYRWRVMENVAMINIDFCAGQITLFVNLESRYYCVFMNKIQI